MEILLVLDCNIVLCESHLLFPSSPAGPVRDLKFSFISDSFCWKLPALVRELECPESVCLVLLLLLSVQNSAEPRADPRPPEEPRKLEMCWAAGLIPDTERAGEEWHEVSVVPWVSSSNSIERWLDEHRDLKILMLKDNLSINSRKLVFRIFRQAPTREACTVTEGAKSLNLRV